MGHDGLTGGRPAAGDADLGTTSGVTVREARRLAGASAVRRAARHLDARYRPGRRFPCLWPLWSDREREVGGVLISGTP
jgi:hypothetical protein